ncbi:hypothetical protein [Butyrivibrio sp. JL13D10]|uniref:hypothetical protein n=1 Tax=Butyrivibrio sp. JL13D10 TaxID=3236815 RepID=UPI0038B64CE0
MMEKRIKELKEFMENEKQKTQSRIDFLIADDREDEARAYRAALNIYDVFSSLIDVPFKQAAGDEKVFKDGFKKLSVNVPTQWKNSLAKAKEHNDAEKIMIEEAKLKVADSIIEKFDELF